MTKLRSISFKLPAFVVAAIAAVAVSLVWIAHRETSSQLLTAASDKLTALRTARAEAIGQYLAAIREDILRAEFWTVSWACCRCLRSPSFFAVIILLSGEEAVRRSSSGSSHAGVPRRARSGPSP